MGFQLVNEKDLDKLGNFEGRFRESRLLHRWRNLCYVFAFVQYGSTVSFCGCRTSYILPLVRLLLSEDVCLCVGSAICFCGGGDGGNAAGNAAVFLLIPQCGVARFK